METGRELLRIWGGRKVSTLCMHPCAKLEMVRSGGMGLSSRHWECGDRQQLGLACQTIQLSPQVPVQ